MVISQILFHLIIIAVGVFGILRGYRLGFLRQMSAVVGVAFGIVASLLLSPMLIEEMDPYFATDRLFNMKFVVATLCAMIIFGVVYLVFRLCLIPLNKFMKPIATGIVNSIAGSLFLLFKYLLFLSLIYNLMIDIMPKSDLARCSTHHDGNVVEMVVTIAPALMGFPGGEEVVFHQQLEDAKKIS